MAPKERQRRGKRKDAEETVDEPTDGQLECVACRDVIKVAAIGSCNHSGTCVECCTRMRIFDNDNRCLLCTTESEKVVATNRVDKPYDEFFNWSDIGTDLKKDELSGIFFDSTLESMAEFERLMQLRSMRCVENGCSLSDHDFITFDNLNKHMLKQHKRRFCETCHSGRKLFQREQKSYSESEYSKHVGFGDTKLGISPHPKCKFCSQHKSLRFFDNDALYAHMKEQHERCFICTKNEDGSEQFMYFPDRPSLIAHLNASHFVCSEAECKDSLIAFGDDAGLRAHQLNKHPHLKVNRRINLSFNVKRDEVPKRETLRENIEDQISSNFADLTFNYNSAFPNELAATQPVVSTPSPEVASTGRWAVTAGSAGRISGALENSSEFPSLPAAPKQSKPQIQLGNSRMSLFTRLPERRSPYSSFSQAMQGASAVNLPAFNRSVWEEERKVKSGKTSKTVLQSSVVKPKPKAPETKMFQITKPEKQQKEIELRSELREVFNDNVNSMHNFKVLLESLSDGKISVAVFYDEFSNLVKSDAQKSKSAKINEAIEHVLPLLSETKKESFKLCHESKLLGKEMKKESKLKLSYLDQKKTHHTASKVDDSEFPTLLKPKTTQRKNGKLDIDGILKANPRKVISLNAPTRRR